jgi:hypothetical protein
LFKNLLEYMGIERIACTFHGCLRPNPPNSSMWSAKSQKRSKRSGPNQHFVKAIGEGSLTMTGYTEKIREIAGRLLKECKVEMVIGFRAKVPCP